MQGVTTSDNNTCMSRDAWLTKLVTCQLLIARQILEYLEYICRIVSHRNELFLSLSDTAAAGDRFLTHASQSHLRLARTQWRPASGCLALPECFDNNAFAARPNSLAVFLISYASDGAWWRNNEGIGITIERSCVQLHFICLSARCCCILLQCLPYKANKHVRSLICAF